MTESELGSEWIGAIFGIRGVDRSLFRFRCGVDQSLDREWIGAWIGVDRSDVRRVRRAWIVSGSEWIGAISVECVELGSLLGLGVDRSLATSSRERIRVWVGAVKA